ncbi:MAG: DMT family transporter [Senegalimassilia faecalis]
MEHRRPTVFNIGAAVLALVGIWLVSVQSGGMTMGYGEAMTLLCALLFAVHMVLVSKLSRFHDVLALTAVQFVAEGCLGFVFGAAFETFSGFGVFTPGIIGQLVFLALFASIVAFGIQNVALAHIPPAQASLFLSLESVFGVLFSIALYGEQIDLAPACRLRADFRSHRNQRNVPAQEENGRSDWGNNRLRTACYRCGRTAFRVIQCGRM